MEILRIRLSSLVLHLYEANVEACWSKEWGSGGKRALSVTKRTLKSWEVGVPLPMNVVLPIPLA